MSSGIGMEFIEKTKFQYARHSDEMLGLPAPLLELKYSEHKNVISLPAPNDIEINDIRLRDAVEKRKSIRNYSNSVMTMSELSFLLWCTQGVKQIVSGHATFRNVPSAGARHAIETYLLVNNIEGLKPGIYRFLALDHKLAEENLEKGIAGKIAGGCLGQNFVKTGSVTFIWTALVYRMNWRYGERGFRYLFLDAGHICQNLYLAGEAVGCGVCAVAAFLDDEINAVLGIDGKEQFAIYIAAVGKK